MREIFIIHLESVWIENPVVSTYYYIIQNINLKKKTYQNVNGTNKNGEWTKFI